MRWIGIALGVQIVVTVAYGIFLLALVAALGPGIREPQLPEPYMAAAMVAGFSFVAAQIGTGILFIVGFAKLYAGAREFGKDHESRIEIAFVLFIATVVAVYASYSIPSAGPTPAPSFVSPTPSALQAFLGPLLGGLAALLAGMALFVAVRTFSNGTQRRRMGIAMALGVAGGAGRQVLMLLGAIGASSPDILPLAVISVAIAGSAVSAASLALFLLAYGDIRGSVESGAIPPSVPRGPWEIPGPPPGNPYWPPPPPSPPTR